MPEACVQVFFPGEFPVEVFINVLSIHWLPLPFLKLI